MPSLNFPFTNILNYTVDSDEMGITSGKMKLALQQDDVDFTEDFADDTDFTYDLDKSEFSGGQVQQKDQKNGALFGANFSIDEDANWSTGSATGTLSGSASITNGKLDLSGGGISYCLYNPLNNLGINQGAIKFKITPKYSGSPPAYYYITCGVAAVGLVGEITLFHTTNGNLAMTIRDDTGSIQVNSQGLGVWGQTADQEYEFELNFNFDAGGSEVRLFIDGVQLGSTITTPMVAGERGRLYFGCEWSESTNMDILVDDITLYDSVQHTSNYTPGYSISDYIYLESNVVLPEMEHTGDGTIKLFNSFSVTYSGSPRILLEIGRSGDKLYYDGASWEVSDETYDQATDPTTFNINCGSLPVDGENYGQFTIVFPDSNTQSSVDELTANMNVDIGYLTTNPYGKINTGFRTDELQGFIATVLKPGNQSDEVTWILENNGSYYYVSGGEWTTGLLQYSNSSTASDIHTYRSTLTDSSSMWYVYFFLHSEDGTSTPELDNLQIDFSYAGETPDTINTCLVWGYTFDGEGNPLTDTFKVRLNKYIVQYGNYSSVLKNEDIEITPDDNGYWEKEFIENENMISPDGEDVKYIFDFGDTNVFEKTVPNEETKSYYDLS